MINPEDLVIENIDRLETEWAQQDAVIARGLSRGPTDDYRAPWHDRSGEVVCPVCLGEWHGLSTERGCPGEFGTDEEKLAYQARRAHPPSPPARTERARRRIRGTARWLLARAATYDRHSGPVGIGGLGELLVQVLNEHVARWPEDEEALMRRFGTLIFAPDGTPVPWTMGGLRTVLGGNEVALTWAMRQLLGRSEESIVREQNSD